MRGRTDNEILDWIDRVGGTDAFLDQTFSGMCDAFRAERAPRGSVVIEWDIRTRDRGVVRYDLTVESGACRVERNGKGEPSVVLSLDMPTFLRLVTGALDGEAAFEAGTLGVAGDRNLARSIRNWFQASN
jgi:hypothetical protein